MLNKFAFLIVSREDMRISVTLSANQRALKLMSTKSSMNIRIDIRRRKKLMLMLMSQLSSLPHKLLMLLFMLVLASQVSTGL